MSAPIEESIFVSRPDGRVHFYPFGWFGPGYVIEDATAEAVLRHRWRKIYSRLSLAACLVLFLAYAIAGLWAVLAICPFGFVFHYLAHKPLVRGLSPSPYRQSFGESQKIMWGNMGWSFYVVLAFAVLATIAGIIGLILLPEPPMN